jgi:predicted nucleic acid-binding protein
MILVDTSVIVAWMDPTHRHHQECWAAIRHWARFVGDQFHNLRGVSGGRPDARGR